MQARITRVARSVLKRGNNNIVRLFIKHGADANQLDSDGLTPLRGLHLALPIVTAITLTGYHSVMARR